MSVLYLQNNLDCHMSQVLTNFSPKMVVFPSYKATSELEPGLVPEKFTLFGLINLVLKTPHSGMSAMTNSAPKTYTPGASPNPLNETSKNSIWGFTPGSELLNGRLAMIGFGSALLIEFFSGQGILHFWNLL
jgi:hypothetical protein